MNFVDIAGLVKGASKGEGLGNQFLATIREVDAVAYVLRCFVDDDVTHVSGKIDPLADFEVVETELMLADMDIAREAPSQRRKKPRGGGDKEAIQTLELLKLARQNSSKRASPHRRAKIAAEDQKAWKMLQLPSVQARLLHPATWTRARPASATSSPTPSSPTRSRKAPPPSSSPPRSRAKWRCCRTRSRRNTSSPLGLEEPGLNRVIRAGLRTPRPADLLHRRPEEARAWTIKRAPPPRSRPASSTATSRRASSRPRRSPTPTMNVRTAKAGQEAEQGPPEGKEYVVQDGDVMHFRFNVYET